MVTIFGTNLEGVVSVNFAGSGSAANLNPDGSIWAFVGFGDLIGQTGPISVYAPYGTATSAQDFTITP
jgi:hypothetical protein